MEARDIILAPVVTEKAVAALQMKKYTFRVRKDANKTISMKGAKRRMGRYEGYTSDWKKAVVTLTPASKTIDFFDGMF